MNNKKNSFFRGIFKKNNYIIENIKNKSKSKNVYENNIKKEKICSLKSIALKTFILFCYTISSVFISFIILNYLLNKNYMVYPKTLFIGLVCFSLIQIPLFILSVKTNLKNQKIISKSIACLQGGSLGFFLHFLKIIYINLSHGVILAFLSTVTLFLIVHFLYYNNIITVNNKFRVFVIVSFFIISMIMIIISLIQRYSGLFNNSMVFTSRPLFLFISLFCLILGCMSLATDFDDANFIVSQKLHKDNEWLVALGFHLNLIYIFIQCIRILIELGFFESRNK
ncbi:Bax inhibitor-1/YccA family membrane protein [Candidatus Phytoplasma sacchari]|uniref:Bax inhibitor-1/YccA family protein n=1 Tax=Candidatus Phytoplasma sacchari TaxID=2609813 RepID=A0ABY7M1V6_9MOLU|nr:Bax inhibitor-1/YccA family protein [Candidatus Phytoplasma sacchari]